MANEKNIIEEERLALTDKDVARLSKFFERQKQKQEQETDQVEEEKKDIGKRRGGPKPNQPVPGPYCSDVCQLFMQV